ncbi:MAG: S-layer homology domain-containing protein [Clostridia bacterium]|nr:S-layer homology domain-containing protein [Clostridia bacterium]
MKKALCLTLVLMLLCTCTTFAASKFADVNGTKYETAVSVLSGSGVIDGYSDGTFKPQNSVTRAELCKLLVSALNLKATGASSMQFPDVGSDMWFYDYVKTAVDNSIIIGYGDGTFKPNNDVTYAEMFTMIIRAMKKENEIPNKSDWPNAYINYAAGYGLLSNVSYSDISFPAIRGEVSVALYNMLNRLGTSTTTSTKPATTPTTETKTVRDAGFVTTVTTKTGGTTAKIEGTVYDVSSKSSSFVEDTFAVFDNTSGEIKLVTYYGVNDLDGNASVVTYSSGSAGDQDIKLDNSSKYSDFSPNNYSSYFICLINVNVNSKNIIEVTKHAMKDSLYELKINKGDRIIEDAKNKVFLVFRGLDTDAEYKNGKKVTTTATTSSSSTKYYTVDYQWEPGAKVSGVSLPRSSSVARGTRYTVKLPKDTDEYIFYSTNYTGTITVNSDITIYIDSEPVEYGGGSAGSNMPLIDRVDESDLKDEIKDLWLEYIYDTCGDSVYDVKIKSVKISPGGTDYVKFTVNYELLPSDEDDVTGLTIPDGVYDEDSGWVTSKQRVGKLYAAYDDTYYIDYSSVGTGW